MKPTGTVFGSKDLLQLVPPWHMQAPAEMLRTSLFAVNQCYAQSPRQPHKAGHFYVLETNDWVNVVAITRNQQLVTIEQFRHATQQVTLEIPGGTVDAGEDPLQAALRELREESGYSSDDAKIIGMVTPNPAIINNRCYTALVCDVEPVHQLELDDNEEIAVRLLPLDAIDALIGQGVIHHALVLAAWLHYRLYTQTHEIGHKQNG